MTPSIRVQRGGTGTPLLLLLHGLGASGDVWCGVDSLLRASWPGSWLIPDLPGHGDSGRLERYDFDGMARAVATALPAETPLAILGHSLGGVIGLTLASGDFGVRVAAVGGLGIKIRWTDEELARARTLAGRPHPVYPTRHEAAERHLKVAGLVGLMAPDTVPREAVIETAAGWTLAFDPAAFAVGAPDMPALVRRARGTVLLAAGERDPMCSGDEIRALGVEPMILSGLGHNAHVESPETLIPLLERLATAR